MITMSQKELSRWEICKKVLEGDKTIKEASCYMGVCYRQARRIIRRAKADGVRGILHKSRGKSPKNAIRKETKDKIISFARTKYKGFNDTYFCEKLNEAEGISVNRETVRKLLRAAGEPPKVKRRSPKHRKRRERMPQAGIMIQMDGSHHDWLGKGGKRFCLMAAIDDATSQIVASHFSKGETTRDYMILVRNMIQKHGIPLSVYVDMHSALKVTRYEKRISEHDIEAQLEGKFYETQVARAFRELGVNVIFARSPQGKGRVERVFGTLQDRMGSELRLQGAKTMEDANKVRARYMPNHNRKFAAPPRESESAWRSKESVPNWMDALCEKYTRTVKNDNTISFEGREFQIEKASERNSYARKKVEVRVKLDGKIEVFYENKKLKLKELGKAVRRAKVCDRCEPLESEATARPKAESTPLDRAIKRLPPDCLTK